MNSVQPSNDECVTANHYDKNNVIQIDNGVGSVWTEDSVHVAGAIRTQK